MQGLLPDLPWAKFKIMGRKLFFLLILNLEKKPNLGDMKSGEILSKIMSLVFSIEACKKTEKFA